MILSYLMLLPMTLATPVADPDPFFPFPPFLAPQHQFQPIFGPGFPYNQRIQSAQPVNQQPVLVIHTLVSDPNQREFGENQFQNIDSFDQSLFGKIFHGENSLFGKIFGGGGIVPVNSLLVKRFPINPQKSRDKAAITKPEDSKAEEINAEVKEPAEDEEEIVEREAEEAEEAEEGSAASENDIQQPNIELLQ